MIEKFKTLLAGNIEDLILAVVLANGFTENAEVMGLMDELALESYQNYDHKSVFFEILEQDYAEKLPSLSSIRRLDLSYCRLSSLPESIAKVSNLEFLDCHRNQLSSLPESIGKLANLKHLDCSENQIVSLPKSMEELVNLRFLDCSNNQIVFLPNYIFKIKQLNYIGNPLSEV